MNEEPLSENTSKLNDDLLLALKEKHSEYEDLQKKNINLEQELKNAKSLRLTIQETLLKNSLLETEKEKLFEVTTGHMMELDTLSSKSIHFEFNNEKIEEALKENQAIKNELAKMKKKAEGDRSCRVFNPCKRGVLSS